jgi:23S rRNA pseudouridine1911/1915/1917 synthase
MSDWTVASPVRLDIFLASSGRMLSRAKAQSAIRGKCVRVNGKVVTKPSHGLQGGDAVTFKIKNVPIEEPKVRSKTLSLHVLYEDDSCMVIDKPRGIAVHPGNGMSKNEVTILDALRPLFKKRSLPFSPSDVLVHRLDKDTTGCLLIAKTPEAHILLQRQFHDRIVKKRYIALVSGVPFPHAAIIDAHIGRHTGDRTKMAVLQSTKSRSARTTYRTLDSGHGAALLALDLHTGRTHQIRVHLKAIGHPVLGDTKYAMEESTVLAEKLKIDFLCLHAWTLVFRSPIGKEVRVQSSVPSTLAHLLSKLGMKKPKVEVTA